MWASGVVYNFSQFTLELSNFLRSTSNKDQKETKEIKMSNQHIVQDVLWRPRSFKAEQTTIYIRGGTRLPSECDYLQKNSSLWRLSMNNRHKRECSAVDFAANCHPQKISSSNVISLKLPTSKFVIRLIAMVVLLLYAFDF